MAEFFRKFFDTSDFPARWYCGNWSDFLGWLHIASDIATFSAYFAIPLVLFYFAQKRRDFPFTKLFWLFGLFIFACGTVHLIEAVIFWHPIYRVSGALKFITATVSWATVVALVRHAPRIMELPSTTEANARLSREVEQRRVSETRFRRLASRYEALLEGTRSIIWTTTAEGQFETVQQSWERYTGQTFEGYRGFGFLDAVHVDDREDLTARWRHARETNTKYQANYRLWHAETNGFRRSFAEAMPVLDEEGKVTEWIGTNTDVEDQWLAEAALDDAQQELKRHNDELEAIYEWSPVGMCSVDRELRFIRVNSRLAEINGLSKQAHLGRRAEEILPELIDQLKPIYEYVFKTGQPIQDIEIVGVTSASEGERVWLASYFPLKPNVSTSGSNVVEAVNAIVQDITERKQQELRLRESERMALSSSRAKSEFLANMSHEIRTPMSAILGYADILLGNLQDANNRNYVLIMKRNGEHLLELINDILDLSRIEAEKLEIEVEPVQLPQLLKDIQMLMAVRAEEKQIDFQVVFEGRIPREIETDPQRLRQVLINLVGNAIKFTNAGHVHIQVRLIEGQLPSRGATDEAIVSAEAPNDSHLTEQTSPQAYLEFAVEDTGIGMSDEQAEGLFQPFTQGDSSVTRQYGGSGLGLVISRRLAQMMKGELAFDSQYGVGSTFFFRLPMNSLAGLEFIESPIPVRSDESPDSPSVPPRLNCRVLVVDDRREIRSISQHFLEKAGASVSTAEDGHQGIEAALTALQTDQPFDLVIMDMQMPNMGGLEATAALRAAGIDWPIIALTADAMKGDRERCVEGGCDDYLTKPIHHAELVKMADLYTRVLDRKTLVERRRKAASDLME